MECHFEANCQSEPKQMGLCECMVSKTVYFALSFHDEHKNINHLVRLSTTQAINYTKVWVYMLIVGRNCCNYNNFQPRHSLDMPVTCVQCVHIFCRGIYIYISSRHTFLIEISVFGFVNPLDCLNTILIYSNIMTMLHFVCFVICPIAITDYVA